jgi:hypothetical protein
LFLLSIQNANIFSVVPAAEQKPSNLPWRSNFAKGALVRNAFLSGIAMAAGVMSVASLARADLIIDPVSASASTEFSGRGAENAVDGGGLSDPTLVDTGATAPASDADYPSQSTDPSTMWMSNGPDASSQAGQYITFNLGSPELLTGFHLWNYNEAYAGGSSYTDRGLDDVTLSFSADGSDFSTIPSQEVDGLTEATGLASYTGETYTLATPVDAQYVRMTIITSYGDPEYNGISEIRFLAPVPEPASLGVVGLSAMGLLARRRARTAK